MSQPSTIAERLLAHARICREIANATMHAETASKLERLAGECIEAARDASAEPPRQIVPLHGRRHPDNQLIFISELSPFSWLTKSFQSPPLWPRLALKSRQPPAQAG